MIPVDVLFNIFLNLPVKILSKFRCVCKEWSSLISSQLFQQHHYTFQSKKDPLLLTTRYQYAGSTITISVSTYSNPSTKIPLNNFSRTVPWVKMDFSYSPLMPLLSCQGLICVGNGNGNILLCNPSTEELIALPPPPTEDVYMCIGLGYVDSTKEFKVFRISHSEMYPTCEVFTLRMTGVGDWRETWNPLPYSINCDLAPFLHGALHFLPLQYCEDTSYIAAFDVENEESRSNQIRFPECQYEYLTGSLCELGGLLCLILFHNGVQEKILELWLLKNYTNMEWEKGYNIDLSSWIIEQPFPLESHDCFANPVAIMADGRILVNATWQTVLWPEGIPRPFLQKGTEFLCYDPNIDAITGKIEEDIKIDGSAVFFTECFFPLGTR